MAIIIKIIPLIELGSQSKFVIKNNLIKTLLNNFTIIIKV